MHALLAHVTSLTVAEASDTPTPEDKTQIA
jgi:hypothetical protein